MRRRARGQAQQGVLLLPVTGGAAPAQPKGDTIGREPRGIRLAAGWQPAAGDITFAEQLGLDAGDTAARFCDYWHAIPGARGRKCDWPATWRNWCRKEADGLARYAARDDRRAGGIVAAARAVLAAGPLRRPD